MDPQFSHNLMIINSLVAILTIRQADIRDRSVGVWGIMMRFDLLGETRTPSISKVAGPVK